MSQPASRRQSAHNSIRISYLKEPMVGSGRRAVTDGPTATVCHGLSHAVVVKAAICQGVKVDEQRKDKGTLSHVL